MSYEKKWKVLADLLIELQKRGEKISADVMKDLRSAKTIIQVLKVDPTHTESFSRMDTYLRNVEAYAIFAAEKLGPKTAEEWLRRIKDTKIAKMNNKTKVVPRFVSGVPRDKKWLRVQTSEDTPLEEVEKLVNTSYLSFKIQENGYILVYGSGKNIKSFVKMMTEQFRGTREA